MKFTIGWLKDYLETDATLDEIVVALTAVGLEVEAVENPAEALSEFKIAEVIEAKQHPDADRLRVCTVNTGTETLQVVCGAPNARTGMKGVFAPVGAYVPGIDVTLKQAKIRGVESNGMLCSEREMMLSDEHDGIIDLDADAPVGASFAEIAGLDDPVIEIAITPNRQDCLGVHGIARDLAAAGLGTFKDEVPEQINGSFDSPVDVHLKFDEGPETCKIFTGRYVRGVANGASPDWMQQRLKAIGLRPISALVDITNYVSYDRGRPLHVYDANKLTGDIHVRNAREGESFTALDGEDYDLVPEACVIADDAGVLGAGGIMGGEDSGCTPETTDVFVECAWFEPIETAIGGRLLGINSDARYRFERGVDPAFVKSGMELATALVTELCGGEASHIVIAGEEPIVEKVVNFRPTRVAALGGLDLPAEECVRILDSLGFGVTPADNESYSVSVPTWRRDVDGEADLVEEVCRIHGYDNIPAVPMTKPSGVAKPTLTVGQKRVRATRRALAANGLMESVTWSFMGEEDAKLFGGGQEALRVDNPISADLNWMRPSILPNLLRAAGRNAARGFRSVRLFEIGPQYADDTPEGQALVVAGIRFGLSSAKHWEDSGHEVNVFDAKRDALTALAAAGAPVANLQTFAEAPGWYHPGRSGTLRLGPKNVLAAFGELHPGALKAMGIKGSAVGFEVMLNNIPTPKAKGGKARAALDVSSLQAVERDFAFVVADDVTAESLLRAVRGADKAHITDVQLFDVYAGKGLEENEKSLAVSVRLEPQDNTFTDDEIEAIAAKIVAAAEKAAGARLR